MTAPTPGLYIARLLLASRRSLDVDWFLWRLGPWLPFRKMTPAAFGGFESVELLEFFARLSMRRVPWTSDLEFYRLITPLEVD